MLVTFSLERREESIQVRIKLLYLVEVRKSMNYIKAIILSALVVVMNVEAAEQGKHLFILSGQSNMKGLQPDKSFIPAVETEFGKDNVIFVLDAESAQPSRRWYKMWKPKEGCEIYETGDLYDRLLMKVKAATINLKIQTVTFVWMQGEQDAKEKHGEVYAESLRGLFSQLGDDLERNDINFVVGRISDYDLDNEIYPHWTLVRKAQVEVAEAEEYGTWVDTDDLNDGMDRRGKEVVNDLHYSAEGYIVLGERFAEKSIWLIKKRNQEEGM